MRGAGELGGLGGGGEGAAVQLALGMQSPFAGLRPAGAADCVDCLIRSNHSGILCGQTESGAASSKVSRSHSVSQTRRPIAASSTERFCPLK